MVRRCGRERKERTRIRSSSDRAERRSGPRLFRRRGVIEGRDVGVGVLSRGRLGDGLDPTLSAAVVVARWRLVGIVLHVDFSLQMTTSEGCAHRDRKNPV